MQFAERCIERKRRCWLFQQAADSKHLKRKYSRRTIGMRVRWNVFRLPGRGYEIHNFL